MLTFPLSVFRVELDKASIPYGFDDGNDVIPPAVPSPLPKSRQPIPTPLARTPAKEPYHLSVKSGEAAEVGINVEGGKVKIEDFSFTLSDTTVAKVPLNLSAGTAAPYKIKITGVSKKGTAGLVVKHTPSDLQCLEFNVSSYSEFTGKAVMLLIEDSTAAGSRLTHRALTPAKVQTELNKTYKRAIAKATIVAPAASTSIPGQPESHVVDLPIWNAARNSAIFNYDDHSADCVKRIGDYMKTNFPNMQCFAIVKRLTTFVPLRSGVSKDDFVVRVGYAGAFYSPTSGTTPGSTVLIGSIQGATTDDETRVIDTITQVGTTNEYDIRFTVKLGKDHPTSHGITFGAAGWSGNPIMVVENTSSEKMVIETAGHELGHSLMRYQDVEDDSAIMHYRIGVKEAGLRHRPMIARYNNVDYSKKKSQWEFLTRT